MLFDSFSGLARVAIVGALAYIGLILFLRISGKRTLSKLNAFDLVVTVALGSTLATTLLSKDVALAEGMLAFVMLIFLQFAITWISVRSKWFRVLVKAHPTELARNGTLIGDAMRAQRITPEEVEAAVRAAGLADLTDTKTVVLETDGTISVVPRRS